MKRSVCDSPLVLKIASILQMTLPSVLYFPFSSQLLSVDFSVDWCTEPIQLKVAWPNGQGSPPLSSMPHDQVWMRKSPLRGWNVVCWGWAWHCWERVEVVAMSRPMDICVPWIAVVEGVWSLVVLENHEMPAYCFTFLLSHLP
jgi:hypothetical protein